jgi:hypothetical protein
MHGCDHDDVNPAVAQVTAPESITEDPILAALRSLIRLIERTGGYLSSEDQRALHDARSLVQLSSTSPSHR